MCDWLFMVSKIERFDNEFGYTVLNYAYTHQNK